MGQVVLLVVAAAWAAVLLPPLLRSRSENRPNSSVLDFRNQLSSLQRVVPTRGVSVRSMGRSLAPSTLSRPAATGRPDPRSGVRANGVVNSRIAPASPATRPTRRDARMQEATLRPRQHGGEQRAAAALAGSRAAEAKRRRANVLFLLVLTAMCAGFLAATTDSKAMVYLFAVAMIALGGYVYLLVTINQQQMQQFGGRAPVERERYRDDAYEPAPQRRRRQEYDDTSAGYGPARRRRPEYVDDGYSDADFWEGERVAQAPRRQAAPAQARYDDGGYGTVPPGSGLSGRISYGQGAVQPTRRDPREPYGRESYGWEPATRETVRRAPVRNGRHATGQVPVQQRSGRLQLVDDYYSNAG